MAKLSEMILSYARSPKLRGRLKKRIRLTYAGESRAINKGVVSDLLIDNGDGTFHFEYGELACVVQAEELELI